MLAGLALAQPAMADMPGEYAGDDIPPTGAVVRCYQSRITQRLCAGCGEITKKVHIPTRYVGYYCGKCCPACSYETGHAGAGLTLRAARKHGRFTKPKEPVSDPLCQRTRRARATCYICGAEPPELHMPEKFSGWYCANCWPSPGDPKPPRREAK